MYIYNVTVNVETEAHEEWLTWMKETHIPDVMETGMFLSNRVLEVLVDHEDGITYSIQYEVKDMETLKLYQQMYAPKLQQEHKDKFEGRFVAFRTILRLEHQYKP